MKEKIENWSGAGNWGGQWGGGHNQLIAKVPHPKWVCFPMWSMEASSR